ncbi:MAG: hypothetical protein CVV27_00910 [Candidatus Melainabacteria bacterium HGW-Melainabacteria-1]|nr:MAG: hypothetical protein CVV27_00910 [Candidatus Melainabacteria bacterium HGW-Melainabacteria-1]
MNSIYTSRDAWEAFRDRQYELACHIWIMLMSSALNLDAQRSYQLNYTHVLVAQQRFEEAEAILQELFDSDPQPIYLHQLAFVAREAGHLSQARDYLLQEKARIQPHQPLLLAGNAYELGIVSWLEGQLDTAIEHAQSALKYAQLADDLSAEGCVHRLLADLMYVIGNRVGALKNYEAARHAFSLAGDRFATNDIDRHMKALAAV